MTKSHPAYSLRPATAAEFPAIRALIREAQINPTGLDWRRFLVAIDAHGRLIGCGQVKPHGDGSRELASITVVEDWRKQGVARAIIERLLDDNPGELYLTCRAELGEFYPRFGFRKVEAPDKMPPYFRRLYRIAHTIQKLHLIPGEMLVMKRPYLPIKINPENPIIPLVRTKLTSSVALRSPNSDTRPLRERLNDALLREQLVLFYQPEVNLATGKVTTLEALIRWQDPTRGAISLARFIRLLEEDELIAPLGKWVLDKACQQLATWQQAGLALLPVAINVSPRQLAQETFVADTLQMIASYNLPTQLVALEVTESMVIHDPEGAIQRLSDLRSHQIAIYLDDFGSGYSSLNYLRRMPVTHLKIDKSFIDDLDPSRSSDQRSTSVLKAIIELAHNLELQVTAEGVENEAQLAILNRLGCDTVQGFYFSDAQPASKIWDTIQRINSSQ